MTTVAVYPNQGDGTQVDSHGGLLKVQAKLVGVTPLLMNAMSEAELLAIRDKTKKPKNAAKPKPRDEANKKVHRLADGQSCIPLTALMSCLIGAGQFIRLDGKRQVSTSKSTVLPGLMRILSTELPITPDTWEVDIQQGRNPNGGEAVCVIRPRFDTWAIDVAIEIDQHEIAAPTIRQLFDIAGSRLGLLDFRPQRKGIFGQFRVEHWIETTPSAGR